MEGRTPIPRVFTLLPRRPRFGTVSRGPVRDILGCHIGVVTLARVIGLLSMPSLPRCLSAMVIQSCFCRVRLNTDCSRRELGRGEGEEVKRVET